MVAEEADEKMIEYAMGGICNCCLDPLNMQYLVENDGVELTVKCLSSSNEETVLSAITTLIYITTPQTKKGNSLNIPPPPPPPQKKKKPNLPDLFPDTTAGNIVELMKKFAESSNKRLSNLANIFLQDCCKLSVGVLVVGRASSAAPHVLKDSSTSGMQQI